MPRLADLKIIKSKIVTDARPKQRREKTVSELKPGSRQAVSRGCRCGVMDFGFDMIIVLPGSCPHHRGITWWSKSKKKSVPAVDIDYGPDLEPMT